MSTRRTDSNEDYERSRQAARFYVQHESESELSPAQCKEWERWCDDPKNCLEYDRLVELRIRAMKLPRPPLPSDDEVREDHRQATAPRRSSPWAGALSPWGYQTWRPLVVNTVLGVALIVMLAGVIRLGVALEKRPSADDALSAQSEVTPYSETVLETSRAMGRPVLVNVGASWCSLCVLNEHNAFGRDSVRRTMARKRIVYLKGEWTSKNESLSAVLRRFGRSGVPLYLLYRPGLKDPEILPQSLTEDIMLNALSKLPDSHDPGT
jgi:hypothetical protein